ncbi:FAD-dependent monooxygenase [bacterium]|nr:FAD-dependent monooxygenase [bacterium]
MKVNILGGGPAGLFLALLLRQLKAEVEVWERNPQDNTFGWGVVFSDATVASFEEPDPEFYADFKRSLRTWENVDIIHRGVLTSVAGNRFSGIARIDLLKILHKRCRELGVRMNFGCEIKDIASLRDCDVLVGSDGVASLLRKRYKKLFKTDLGLGKNRYIWYGTRAPFQGLTLTFRMDGPDLFMAHSYKYSDELSTFIVEVDEPTWERVRFLGERRARARLEKVFEPELGGQPLLSNRSKWIRFVNVYNQNWWAENMVLLGDALHTAHFSIGSGTKLAMEDALALWRTLREGGNLAEFEATRRPKVDRFIEAANTSQRWFETARDRMHLDVLPFCYEAMTRSSRVDDEILRRRDPEFVKRYEDFKALKS